SRINRLRFLCSVMKSSWREARTPAVAPSGKNGRHNPRSEEIVPFALAVRPAGTDRRGFGGGATPNPILQSASSMAPVLRARSPTWFQTGGVASLHFRSQAREV